MALGRVTQAELIEMLCEIRPDVDWRQGQPPGKVRPGVVEDLVTRFEAVDLESWDLTPVRPGKPGQVKAIGARESDLLLTTGEADELVLARYTDATVGINSFILEGVLFGKGSWKHEGRAELMLDPRDPETGYRYHPPHFRPVGGRNCLLPQKYVSER